MKYEDLSKYQKIRIRGSTCPICGEGFSKFDDIQELKMKYGKAMIYYHFHSACLLSIKVSSQLEPRKEDTNAKAQ